MSSTSRRLKDKGQGEEDRGEGKDDKGKKGGFFAKVVFKSLLKMLNS